MRTLLLVVAALVAAFYGLVYFGLRNTITIENPEEGADWT